MKLLIGYAGKEFLESGYIFAPYIPLQEASIFNINQLAANTKKLMNRKVIIKTYWDDEGQKDDDLGIDIFHRVRAKYGRRLRKLEWIVEEDEAGKHQIYLASQPSITDVGMSPRKRVMSV